MGIKQRIALTGRPGVGKTTLIERVIHVSPESFGGFIVRESVVCGHRVGFVVINVATGQQEVLAHIHQRTGPQVGKYKVNPGAMRDVAIPAIEEALQMKRTLVIDEFAPMELTSPQFVPAVETALASNVGLIIATHATLDHPLVHRIRQELRLVRVKLSNRDRLAEELSALFTKYE